MSCYSPSTPPLSLFRLTLFAFLFGSGGLASAQQAPLVLPRFEGELVLDGLPIEPGWRAVAPLPAIQYEPFAGEPPTEPTEFRFAYDDEYLYASLAAYDRDRSGIRANTLYRDRLSGDDHFEFLLDTFNDNESAIVFTTTPAGIRRESAIINDASGGGLADGGWLNVDYNTYWDVETQITDEGWFAEVRIPFSSLRFQDDDGRVVMGLIVQRKIARRAERLVFPTVQPDVNWAFLKPSRAQKVVMEGVFAKTPLYVTPYALSGIGQQSRLSQAGSHFYLEEDVKREVGLDVKYSVTNNLTLDLTANTDFAQAEADDQQVNLTRFSLFYPDKRQFFQERAGLFEFRTGGDSRLFHSRRIGLTDAGQPVRILGGARLVGKVGEWDLGLLDLQTAESHALPSENFGVLRMRRKVLNAYSHAGGIVTSRVGNDGSYNLAYGLDGVLRIAGDDYLSLQWAYTADSDVTGLNALNGGLFRVAMERRRRAGFGYESSLLWSGPNYLPGIGFVQRRDFTLLDQRYGYTWMPGEESGLIWHTLQIRGAGFMRNGDGSIESAFIRPSWTFSTTTLASGQFDLEWQHEDLLRPFFLSPDAFVPAGTYGFIQAGAEYSMPRTNLFNAGIRVEGGSFFDGWQARLAFTPTWFVSQHLELGSTYELNRIRFPDRDQKFDAHVLRLRIGTALNTHLSTNAFVQFNSAADAVSANIRFRYNFREGNDLWIVVNEGLNTDTYGTPTLPRIDNRTVLIKYTHTFAL